MLALLLVTLCCLIRMYKTFPCSCTSLVTFILCKDYYLNKFCFCIVLNDMFLDVQGPDNDENKDEGRKDGYSEDQCLVTSDFVDGSWPFFSAMHSVMEAIKATSPDGGAKSRRSPEYTCKCLLQCSCVYEHPLLEYLVSLVLITYVIYFF